MTFAFEIEMIVISPYLTLTPTFEETVFASNGTNSVDL